MKLVFASSNVGKIIELKALLEHLPLAVIPQTELNVPDAAETGLTFVENAILKARQAAKLTGLPALADDSGLVVPALYGQPGIYSARYSGVGATAASNIAKLLKEMETIPVANRQAMFHCVLVLLLHTDDPIPLICHGTWQGTILTAEQGAGGFGYDPVFWLSEENKTAAELSLEIKNRLSHRAKAMQQLLKQLPEKLC